MLYRALTLIALTLTACGDEDGLPDTVVVQQGPAVIDVPIGGDECWQNASAEPIAHVLAPPNGVALMACHADGGREYCTPQSDWWVAEAEAGGFDVFWACGAGGLAESMKSDGHVLISYW